MKGTGPRVGNIDAPGTHLLTFGDGSERWRRAAKRLMRQAEGSRWFGNVTAWDASDLEAADPHFFVDRAGLYRGAALGFGYWSWKPFMLRWYLENPDLGADRILYLDSGVHLNTSASARRRFCEYETLVHERSVLLMQCQGLPEREWTKSQVLTRLMVDSSACVSSQIMATLLMVDRSDKAISFCREWEALTMEDGGQLLLDPETKLEAGPDLRAHRHDQSILSCLAKSSNLEPIPDEAYFAPNWGRGGVNYPLWAVRNRTGVLFTDREWLYKSKRVMERAYLRLRFPRRGGLSFSRAPSRILRTQ